MSLNKVAWGLLSRDCNERYALIGRFKPDNLGLVLLAILLMTARVTFTLLALSFLFLLCGLTTWPQEPKRTKSVSQLLILEE